MTIQQRQQEAVRRDCEELSRFERGLITALKIAGALWIALFFACGGMAHIVAANPAWWSK